jgi:hypothetical protein
VKSFKLSNHAKEKMEIRSVKTSDVYASLRMQTTFMKILKMKRWLVSRKLMATQLLLSTEWKTK